jgi:Na+/H+-dicarboxylate symporter
MAWENVRQPAGPFLISVFFLSLLNIVEGVYKSPGRTGPDLIGYSLAPLALTLLIVAISLIGRSQRNLRSAARTAAWTLFITLLLTCMGPARG